MDVTIIIDSLPSLLKATLMTILLAAISIIIALVLGFFAAIVRILKVRILNGIATAYVSIIRGTPLLVQIFVIYYGLPQIGISLDPISSGVVALSLNAGAYLSESFRAAILAVDNGQMEASLSMGMTYSQALRRIILPQSLRIAIPTLSNTFIVLIKDTSLVSVITVTELLQMSSLIIAKTFEPLTIYLLAAAIYWILITFFTTILDKLEVRTSKYLVR
ncbi:MAG: amino acid ABC transporter permease [Psychrobacillus psychrotolerans]|jgi:amino acid ABC transporter, permease protein, 3-TM region, His/Glu/Gln/Arg/opine family|uniref:Amino acid ABC transporter membrane protein, PAAT family n=1 Tax=Psychrobacillus psychrotolerans TaxID=126156 RepID=A0A1I5Y1R1_9BACI|nr:amino acid ABC transporter permease [Psychrobacillus psychrotolerans]SFQ38050.1 amino acid ABC transporter membrane protein, PAAT family [Psychrobacillus psychrotolerans]